MNKSLIWILLFVPSIIMAGEIYGTIAMGKRPVGQGWIIEVKCGTSVVRTRTDRYGSYSIYIHETGRCELRVYGVKGIVMVYSTKTPVRYDLVILKDQKGNRYLRRK